MILVLSPHTDDGELGCGGLLARKGGMIVAFSDCGNPDLRVEFSNSCYILGVKKELYSLEHRNFFKYRQDILDQMIELREEYNPDIVISPSLNDAHQDHRVIAEEALRAFRNTKLLNYELPWNNLNFDAEMFVVLGAKDILKKVKALSCYKSQRDRLYMNNGYVVNQARYHGVRCGQKYAEVYEIIRWII